MKSLPPETPLVVAVSGLSGAGKSALVVALQHHFGSGALHFDDYAGLSVYPPDLRAWLDSGADANAWEIPRLVEDLRRLKAGEPVQPPGRERPVEPSAIILVEQPLGRLHGELDALIDLSVYVEVPLDLLLLRRLSRLLSEEGGATDPRLPERITDHFAFYLALGRDLSENAHPRLRSSADLVLDGTLPIEALAPKVILEIGRLRPR